MTTGLRRVSIPCGRSSARSSSSTDIRRRFSRARRSGYENLAALVTLARVGQWEAWDKKAQGKRRGRPKVTWAQVAAHADGSARADRPGRPASSRHLLRAGKDERGRSGESRPVARGVPGRRPYL